MLLKAQPIVDSKLNELRQRVEKLKNRPKLTIIRVGEDKESEKYVNNTVKQCKEVGIESEIIYYPSHIKQEELEICINSLNKDANTTAILLQLPLPVTLDEHYLTSLITPEKDVDGFTEANIGKLVLGQEGNVACTPQGVISLLKHYNIPIEGKDVLIINRSNIVGKPLAHLMLKENATVTIAHSKTRNLYDKIWNSDIVVSAVGKANFLNYGHFSPYTTIIDVSINFDENGKMCGDVAKQDYEEIVVSGCNISVVPGGVGQLTVLSLIEQTIKIAERKEK